MNNGAWSPVWKIAAICLTLAALVWVVFGQTLAFQFINLDDATYVFRNPHVVQGVTFPDLKWAFTHFVAANWHPLTLLSHMLDCQIFGVWPGGHHLTNVILHTFATVGLFLVLYFMTNAIWRSAFVAAVFGIHPLHVESVAWIAERKDVLSAVFFVSTIAAYALFAQKRTGIRYLAVVICFALGLMAKPMLVTVPFVLLLLDYWPLQRFGRSTITKLLLEKVPLLVLSAISCAVTISAQAQSINLVQTASLGTRVGNAFLSVLIYLQQTFWPSNLALFYPYPENTLVIGQIFIAAAVIVAATVAAILFRKSAPYFVTGWFWFLGMLIPVIGVVQVGLQAHADRYMYLPQVGIILVIVWAFGDLSIGWRYRQTLLGLLGFAVLAPLALTARVQTSYWTDSEKVWQHTVAVTSANQFAREHLADAYLEKGRVNDAVEEARISVKESPTSADAHGVLGAALVRAGQLDNALTELREALAINPKLPRAHYNLGNVFLQRGEVGAAISNYESELEIEPGLAELHNNLASALFRSGQPNKAMQHLQTALKLNPNYAEARNNLAIGLSQTGKMPEAISEWNRTLAIEPNNLQAQCNLAWVLATSPSASIRNGALALQHAQRALVLSGKNNARIWRLVAVAQAELGRFDAAIDAAEKGLRLARDENDSVLAQTLESNIAQFRSGSPLRDSR